VEILYGIGLVRKHQEKRDNVLKSLEAFLLQMHPTMMDSLKERSLTNSGKLLEAKILTPILKVTACVLDLNPDFTSVQMPKDTSTLRKSTTSSKKTSATTMS
jgi:hypothetical protein